jgi:asparagine synthase (glutamine-hydrolysing)
MCGIAGILFKHERNQPLDAILEPMVASIRHRGPDEQHWIARGRAGLGIARLSIIDPEGSHQPLYNEARDVALVFNGEIYNYLELRTALEQNGHRFATRGDGEVIVHGYEQWGTGVFEKLRGMFAIAIWDERAHWLVLARDRMGIKPLYLCRTGDAFLFASEVKALFASGRIGAELRPELLDCYLAFRYVPAPESLFRGVTKLGVGEFMVVEEGGSESIQRYYTPSFTPKLQLDEAEAARQLRELLEKSMDYHLQSDVPLGVFLSGGLDSGFLTAMARAKSSAPLNTFSVGFDRGGIYDETSAAAVAAKKFGTIQHSLRMNAADYLGMLPDAVYYMDEPMADPSSVPMMAISRIAREHVKVVLSGEGSDELFGGYARYQGEMMASRMTPPQVLGRVLARSLPLSRSRARGVEGIAIHDPARRHLFWETIIPEGTRAALLADGVRNGTNHALEIIQRIEAEALATGDIDAVDRLYFLDLRTWLVEDLLLKKDKMGMSASIEARVPFLDQDVVAFALRLPGALKVRGFKGKRVFRRVISGYLPEEILNRPKVGFAVPLNDWFRHEMAHSIRSVLLDKNAFVAPYLQRPGIEQLFASHHHGKDRSLELLTLLVLELWGRIHLRGEARADVLARYQKSA